MYWREYLDVREKKPSEGGQVYIIQLRKVEWAEHIACMTYRMCTKLWSESVEGRYGLGGLGIGGSLVLKFFVEK